jgi:multiple sugar transport system substrate-binding protein
MYKNLTRKTCLYIIFTIVMVILSNCSKYKDEYTNNNQTETRGEIVLTFWNLFTGPDGQYMDEIINKFNRESQGKVRVESKVLAYSEYYSKIIPSVAKGVGPDLGIMHISKIPIYKDILVPVDNLVSEMGLSEKDFLESIWKSGIIGNARYAIPLDIHCLGLYYNVDILKENGFENPPANFDDFIDISKKCTSDTDGDGIIDQWGIAMSSEQSALYWSLLYQFGGEAFSEDGKIPMFNSNEGIEALQLLYDFIYKYKIAPIDLYPYEEMTLFKNSKAAFYINGTWVLSELENQQNLNFETAPLPVFGKYSAVWANSHNFVLFKNGNESEKKREEIKKFISYVLNNSLEWAKAGQIPALNIVRNSRDFCNLKRLSGFISQKDYFVFPKQTENYFKIWQPVENEIINVLKGRKDVKEALNYAEKKALENIN